VRSATYLGMSLVFVGIFLVFLNTLPTLQALEVESQTLRFVHSELAEFDVLTAHAALLGGWLLDLRRVNDCGGVGLLLH